MNHTLYLDALGDEEKTLAFRKISPRTVFSDERRHLALKIARDAFDRRDFDTAEPWALRALHDGPSVDVLSLLGDICQDTGDLETALYWYELACACTAVHRYDDPAVRANRQARFTAIRREAREEWEARVPLRELNFQSVPAYPLMGYGDPNPECSAILEMTLAPLNKKRDFIRTVVLDDDLEFIAFKPDLKLPHEPNLPHAMWVLPVREVPEIGEVLLLSPRAAAIASGVKSHEEFIKALPAGAKYGAFTGVL